MIVVAPHAVEQLIARWAPGLTHAAARKLLEDGLSTAERLVERTAKGDRAWRLRGDLPAILVVRADRQRPDHDVVVTVLPPGSSVGSVPTFAPSEFGGRAAQRAWAKLQRAIAPAPVAAASAPPAPTPPRPETVERRSAKRERIAQQYREQYEQELHARYAPTRSGT